MASTVEMLDSGEGLAGDELGEAAGDGDGDVATIETADDELDEAAGDGKRVLKTYVLLPLNGWTRP